MATSKDKETNPEVKGEQPEDLHETNGFIFIYEYDGKLYPRLRYVHPSAGETVIIHPVYYSGYNNTMTSEELRWNSETGKFVTTSSEGSWLDTLKQYKDLVYPIDTNDVVYHDGHYYHCDGCLLESLVDGFTIVPIELIEESKSERSVKSERSERSERSEKSEKHESSKKSSRK